MPENGGTHTWGDKISKALKGYWYDDGKVKYEAFLNQYNYKTILLEERDLKEIEVI